ncbi:type VI secretion system amidase effector protein Tae4 [Mixta intestinalis]|jgi:hypothetical protein|uniref:Cytoplasmic protein n=1 Tax=Mixta intestinalis TaxID=1615494 RepID=A0A6P1Q6F3_9GAMM|nr:type VI secretion system amidase effector protein Tae4 [Mixta intestinalis]QHM73365.1 hypothetical protein C7M51_03712 [Mixta intestinalis]
MRPTFSAAWSAALRIYHPSNSAAKVAETIGGYVKVNINNPDAKKRWTNTCAVRMSYILNYSGMRIPALRGQTVTGGDKRQYFFRVNDLIQFLKYKWGAPEIVSYPPADAGKLSGRQGVILFQVTGWSDANGHATLFNGVRCYDRCYFNEPEARYHTERANFWSLQ